MPVNFLFDWLLIGRMADCLISYLADCTVSYLADCIVSYLADFMVVSSVGLRFGSSVYELLTLLYH